MKKLDKLENEFLPQVMVDNTEVIFDTVRFLEAQSRILMIANTGKFEFILTTVNLFYRSLQKNWQYFKNYTY